MLLIVIVAIEVLAVWLRNAEVSLQMTANSKLKIIGETTYHVSQMAPLSP